MATNADLLTSMAEMIELMTRAQEVCRKISSDEYDAFDLVQTPLSSDLDAASLLARFNAEAPKGPELKHATNVDEARLIVKDYVTEKRAFLLRFSSLFASKLTPPAQSLELIQAVLDKLIEESQALQESILEKTV